jgi:hypothetical protein
LSPSAKKLLHQVGQSFFKIRLQRHLPAAEIKHLLLNGSEKIVPAEIASSCQADRQW